MEKVHWISQDNPIGLACDIEAIGPIGTITIEYVTCSACRDTYEAQNRAAAVVRGSLNHVIEERLARLARTEEKLEQAEKALVANGFTEVARGQWKPPPVKPNPPEVRYVALLDSLELLLRECRKGLSLDK